MSGPALLALAAAVVPTSRRGRHDATRTTASGPRGTAPTSIRTLACGLLTRTAVHRSSQEPSTR